MTNVVSKNGNISLKGKIEPHTPILVLLRGIKFPIYSSVRSNGVANVGRKWAGFEYQVRVVPNEV